MPRARALPAYCASPSLATLRGSTCTINNRLTLNRISREPKSASSIQGPYKSSLKYKYQKTDLTQQQHTTYWLDTDTHSRKTQLSQPAVNTPLTSISTVFSEKTKDRRATTASTLLSPSYLLSASAGTWRAGCWNDSRGSVRFLASPPSAANRARARGRGGFAARARCDVTDSEGVVGRRPRRYSVR